MTAVDSNNEVTEIKRGKVWKKKGKRTEAGETLDFGM